MNFDMAGTSAGQQGQDAAPETMSSFFPSPPAGYTRFTDANIALAKKLVGHADFLPDLTSDTSKTWQEQQSTILSLLDANQETIDDLKDLDLRTVVQPPNIEFVERDGHWTAFGQVWPINEALPSLAEMGVQQLFPDNTNYSSEGRRAALRALLHTLLLTYLQLLNVLLKGPPSIQAEQEALDRQHQQLRQEYENRQSTVINAVVPEIAAPQAIATEADRAVDHLRLCAVNVHHLCNEWRPVQARETLKVLMQSQIDERKERTAELRKTCGELRDRLAVLPRTRLPDSTDDLARRMAGTTVDAGQESPRTSQDSRWADKAQIGNLAKQKMWKTLDDIG